MASVIYCIICLALGNFCAEALRDIPNYVRAADITWAQAWAIVIYNFVWVKE